MYKRQFLNSNQVIKRYLEQFSSIPHLDLIRFGTRIPVVLPMRIYDDPELLALLKTYTQKKQIYVVTQFNQDVYKRQFPTFDLPILFLL